jgi:glyoxylase-like metal-dependent hydrolase (beta-lactamase superfamily II)
MRVTTHGDNLIQITRLTFVNVYLVRENDGFTVIDTGLGGTAGNIIDTAKQHGLPIKRITLTHAHGDHIGSVDALRELLPDAEISISERDARFLKGDMSLDPNEPQTKLRGGYQVIKTTPDRLLQPGDKVGSLEVIASPGHTPGHIAFFDQRDGTLIAGDAYTTKAGLSTAGALRLLFPFPAMATWNKPLGLQSAENLLTLKPKRLATGHGDVLENPVPDMERAIAEARTRLGVAHASPKTN